MVLITLITFYQKDNSREIAQRMVSTGKQIFIKLVNTQLKNVTFLNNDYPSARLEHGIK